MCAANNNMAEALLSYLEGEKKGEKLPRGRWVTPADVNNGYEHVM